MRSCCTHFLSALSQSCWTCGAESCCASRLPRHGADSRARAGHIAQHGETGQYFNHEEMRPRILLAHKEEIKKIDKSCQTKGHTVVPLKVYFNDNGFLKCEVGVCRGKNLANKKEAIKGRDQARDAKRELKSMGY